MATRKEVCFGAALQDVEPRRKGPHSGRVRSDCGLPSEACDAVAALRNHPRIYQDAERDALILLWEAADRVFGKRLKALPPILIESMERHGHIDLVPGIRAE
jgi:hypothetical protein